MDLGLKDKVAIVGGASQGLGRACTEVLAQEGAKVVICSRTLSKLEKTAEEIREATGSEVLPVAGDLDNNETIVDLVKKTIDHFGRVDILVNNSGGPPHGDAVSATEEDWDISIQRSLLYFTRMCREAIPHMKQQGGGRIINILSNSVYTPIFNLALSGATRMAVVAYAKSLADEVGPHNILVNNVGPGSILTDRMLSNVQSKADHEGISLEEGKKRRAATTSVKRLGDPEELAYLVAFLASDKASFITGTTIRVDGGAARSVL
jgi:3-oxoacyl-[acyl-carrier protein] reductase